LSLSVLIALSAWCLCPPGRDDLWMLMAKRFAAARQGSLSERTVVMTCPCGR
jgi:hypothetical protein